MSWPSLCLVFLASHLVGDYLLQTDRQAREKWAGLGADRRARRALLGHVGTYTLAFLPVLVWLAVALDPGVAVATGLLVALPHLLIDDGRLLRRYIREVKGCENPGVALTAGVDQSLHALTLLAVALIGAS